MKLRRIVTVSAIASLAIAAAAPHAVATHDWNGYHWGRTANPFTLTLGDNVSSKWDASLAEAASDWSASAVLDMTVGAGNAGNPKRCAATSGRVEVCSAKYGNTGWLGVAGITLSRGHITSAYVKVNDTYYDTPTYDKPEWRRYVMCQEVGHAVGLDHVNETFNTPNVGTCMDYTNNPLGPPSNEHPYAHDFEELASLYGHTDSTTTVGGDSSGGGGKGKGRRGRVVDVDARGNGTVTFITWVQ